MSTLTKSHVTALRKVSQVLRFQQKMTDRTQLILNEANQQKFKNADRLINEAIQILETVK